MKHWQRCERTASMKQMGAKCGNEEAKKQQHTHRDLQQALYAYMDTNTRLKHTKEGDTEGVGGRKGGTAAFGLQSRDSKERPRFRHKPTDANKINKNAREKRQRSA